MKIGKGKNAKGEPCWYTCNLSGERAEVKPGKNGEWIKVGPMPEITEKTRLVNHYKNRIMAATLKGDDAKVGVLTQELAEKLAQLVK